METPKFSTTPLGEVLLIAGADPNLQNFVPYLKGEAQKKAIQELSESLEQHINLDLTRRFSVTFQNRNIELIDTQGKIVYASYITITESHLKDLENPQNYSPEARTRLVEKIRTLAKERIQQEDNTNPLFLFFHKLGQLFTGYSQ